jgi:transposase
MAELVSDALWNQIEPLLPPLPPRSPKGGRPRVEHRPALTGIVFVLKTGIPWQELPTEMGCGSGSTCWRRFAKAQDWWTPAGVVAQSALHGASPVVANPFKRLRQTFGGRLAG